MKRNIWIGILAILFIAATTLCAWWPGVFLGDSEQGPALAVESPHIAQPQITDVSSVLALTFSHLEPDTVYSWSVEQLEQQGDGGWHTIDHAAYAHGRSDFATVDETRYAHMLFVDKPFAAGRYRVTMLLRKQLETLTLTAAFTVHPHADIPAPTWDNAALERSPYADAQAAADARLTLLSKNSAEKKLTALLQVDALYHYGAVYALEVQRDGVWRTVPLAPYAAFILPLYEISPDSDPNGREIEYWLGVFGVLPAGDYRLVQPFEADGTPYAALLFSLTEPILE